MIPRQLQALAALIGYDVGAGHFMQKEDSRFRGNDRGSGCGNDGVDGPPV
jgi:hypothetical protein